MRAPILTLPQTRPAQAGLAYRSDAGATPSAFGADIGKGLGDVGAGLVEYGLAYEAANKQAQRFGALVGESDLNLAMTMKVEELKRAQVPGTMDFPAKLKTELDKTRNDWIGKLPPSQQREFRARTDETVNRFMVEGLDFQYQSNQSFYEVGINKAYVEAQNGVQATPAEFDAHYAKVMETIDASGLLEAQKLELKAKMDSGLRAVLYGKTAEQIAREAPLVTGPGPEGARQLLYKFENSPDNVWLETHWDSDHWRIGYSSDTITLADGTVKEVQKGDTITRADAERDLTRRINLAAAESAEKMGADVWGKLGGQTQAALISVAYNYGSLPASIVAAAQTGDREQLANAVAGLSANKARRQQEADIIRGTAGIETQAAFTELDADPRFSSVPLETRLTLQADARAKVNKEIATAAGAAKAEYDAAINTLLTGIHDGGAGPAEVSVFRDNNPGMPYEDITKIDSALKQKEVKVSDQQAVEGMIAANGAGYSTSMTEKYNNWFEESGGAAKVAAMDQGYMNTTIVGAGQSLGDYPPQLIGQLEAMTRSQDTNEMLWAYKNLAMLEDKGLEAFRARVDEVLAGNVDSYRYGLNSLPLEELSVYLRGGNSEAARRMSQQSDAMALRTISDPNSEIAKLAADPVQLLTRWWRDDKVDPALFTQQLELRRDLLETYKFYYRIDPFKALEMTGTHLERIWGTAKIGLYGANLMRLPPDKAGYKISPAEAEADIRELYHILPSEEVFLQSDEITATRFHEWQKDSTKPLTSYKVFKVLPAVTADDGSVPSPSKAIEVTKNLPRWTGAQ